MAGMAIPDLRAQARELLICADPTRKAAATRCLASTDPVATDTVYADAAEIPGRPERPALVGFNALKRRSAATPQGRAVLLHALAHIEFNAINLALDIVWRFAGLPEAFYRQWVTVAREEALHFELLRAHLQTLGHDYGDFPAHDGLWEMAHKTRDDPLARLALVPRTLEARGLDATPLIQGKLRQAGDLEAVAILDVLLRDEVGHVAIGNHWYHWLCRARGVEPLAHYRLLSRRHQAPRLRGPFNLEARGRAGFSAAELDDLQAG